MIGKTFFAAALALMLGLGAQAAHAQARSLGDAIRHVAGELSASLGAGASIAVVSMYAGTEGMSNFVINEMIDTFVRAGRFTVVDRAQLELTARELDFSMSGEVDDLTAQMVGRRIGAQTIVTGAFEPFGADFRLRARIIQVEGAIIQGASSSVVPRGDPLAASFLGGAAHAARAPRDAGAFTSGQRWGTWGLNALVPGLGSFVVMRDTFGGAFQAACGGVGFILLVVGVIGREVEEEASWGWGAHAETVWEPNYPALIGGLLLMATSGVFNIARSATFSPRAPRAGSIADPEAWSIGIAPGAGGIEGVSLSRRIRF